MPVNHLIDRSITTILWATVGLAFLGSFTFLAFRILMLIASMGMLCDSCGNQTDLVRILGVQSAGLIMLIGAMVLIIWHVDRWPHKLAAPAMLAVALLSAPADTWHHWFWWLGA
ncbi:hypothetical protein [Reyranella sp.]|uniref:hypothetical protein n=1 Tax=Reyranella sp. TaxID=1929291 RepID=UPI003BAA636C